MNWYSPEELAARSKQPDDGNGIDTPTEERNEHTVTTHDFSYRTGLAATSYHAMDRWGHCFLIIELELELFNESTTVYRQAALVTRYEGCMDSRH